MLTVTIAAIFFSCADPAKLNDEERAKIVSFLRAAYERRLKSLTADKDQASLRVEKFSANSFVIGKEHPVLNESDISKPLVFTTAKTMSEALKAEKKKLASAEKLIATLHENTQEFIDKQSPIDRRFEIGAWGTLRYDMSEGKLASVEDDKSIIETTFKRVGGDGIERDVRLKYVVNYKVDGKIGKQVRIYGECLYVYAHEVADDGDTVVFVRVQPTPAELGIRLKKDQK